MSYGSIVKVLIVLNEFKWINIINTITVNILLPFSIAFQCILHGKPLDIPTEITAEYVRFAEEIAAISYSQSETFSSVST